MTMFDWHAERSDLEGIALLDTETTDEAIDLVAVRTYRQGRGRRWRNSVSPRWC